jgi:hypothetical protein
MSTQNINGYPIDRLTLGDDDYFDIDYYNGSSYETAKIKGSVIKALLSSGVNIYNTDDNLTGNRTLTGLQNNLTFTDLALLINQAQGVIFDIDMPIAPLNEDAMLIQADPSLMGTGTGSYIHVKDKVALKTIFKVVEDGRLYINEEYFLPNTDGNANDILRTDGIGNVSFDSETISKIANGNTLVEVTSSGDLPSTLAANTTYLIRGTISTSTEISVTNEGSQIIGFDRSKDKIEFTGLSGTTFLTITDVNFSMSDVWLSSTNTGSLLIDATNVTGAGFNLGRDKILSLVNVQFRNCFDVMDVKGFDLVDLNNCLFFYVEAPTYGASFQDVSKLEISSCEFIRWFDETTIPTPSGFSTANMIELRSNNLASFGAVNINGCIIHPQQNQNGIFVDPLSTTGFGTIAANTFVDNNLNTPTFNVFSPSLGGLPDYSQTYTYKFDAVGNQGLLDSRAGVLMTMQGNSSPAGDTALTLNVPTKINTNALNVLTEGVRFTAASDGRATYNGTKQIYVSIHARLSFTKLGGGTADYSFFVYKNGVQLAPSESTNLGSSSSDNKVIIYATLVSQNDYLEFFVENTSNNDDILVTDWQVVIRQ